MLCGLLGERYGWHVGFGAAAIFMLGGLATYLSGYRYLPARVERKDRGAATPLTPGDRKIVAALILVMAITVFPHIAYYQLANVLPVWLQEHASMNAGGFAVSDPVVSVDRPPVQHHRPAIAVRVVALAGTGHRQRTVRSVEDRHGLGHLRRAPI